MKSIKKFLLVAAACVAVLGFVSCASDDDSGSSSDPAIAIFEYESGYVWTWRFFADRTFTITIADPKTNESHVSNSGRWSNGDPTKDGEITINIDIGGGWTSTETIADGVLKYSVDHKSYKRTK